MNPKNTAKISTTIYSYSHPRSKYKFFRDLEFEICGGEILSVIGLSGVGKSTLLQIMLGQAQGVVDADVSFELNEEKLVQAQVKLRCLIGFLSPVPSLVPWKNLQENLLLPSAINRNARKPTPLEIEDVLSKVGLDPKILSRHPYQASFGMQHRIALARLLLYSPKFLLLDELFTGLDEVNSDFIAEHIVQFVKAKLATCMLVTHDVKQAIKMSDRILFLDSNQKLKLIEGTTEEHIKQMLLEDFQESMATEASITLNKEV